MEAPTHAVPQFATILVVQEPECRAAQVCDVVEHPPTTDETDHVEQDHAGYAVDDWETNKGDEHDSDLTVGEGAGGHSKSGVDGSAGAERREDRLVSCQGLRRRQARRRGERADEPRQADNVGVQVRAERRCQAREEQEGEIVRCMR